MIDVASLSVTLNGAAILHDISFHINDGELAIIVGPNGAGKSTLLKTMLHILHPASGNVAFNGRDTASFSRKDIARFAAYCPQMKETMPPITVREFLLLSRFPYTDYFSSYTADDHRLCESAAASFGLTPFLDRSLDTLSGGELQSVMIASAIVQETPVIFLDEPTVFLDMNHRQEIFEMLSDIHRTQKKTIVLVTHFIDYALNYADRIIAIKQGGLFFNGTPDEAVKADIATGLFDTPIEYLNHNGKFVTVIR